jgi:ribose transport system ATP-binding protein
MSLVQVHGISKSFGATRALDNVDLEVRPGEVHALVGENGAGKSTLMNILSGALRPDTGTIHFRGRPYRPGGRQNTRRRGIAYIHQELSLCPHLSVAENIFLGAEPGKSGRLDWSALHKRSLGILQNFHPAPSPECRVAELPLSARQVVEISRALAQDASLILMDEPTSSLPRDDVERLFACIRRLRDSGIGVIYISHFLEEVRAIADRVTVLRDGASVMTGALREVTDREIITGMVGRPMENLYPRRGLTSTDEPVLQVSHLAAPPAVHEASFDLYRGEILGIAGLIGSGRTEMVRTLLGLLPTAAGEVMVGDTRVAATGREAKLQKLMAQGIGYLSEDRKTEGLALELSIADNVTMTNYLACSRWGWLDLDMQARQTSEWIAKLHIRAEGPRSAVATLSGGNQQKVALARLLHQGARIVLLDEPTRGVDIGSKAHIYETIAGMTVAGKSVLMVSSYLPELFGMCDRIAVMVRGTLSPARRAAEWTPESLMKAATGSNLNATSPGAQLT